MNFLSLTDADLSLLKRSFSEGDFLKAEGLLRLLCERHPKEIQLFYFLAQALFAQGKKEAAVLVMEALLLQENASATAAWYNDYAVMLSAVHRFSEAENMAQIASTLGAGKNALFNLAQAQLRQAKLTIAQNTVESLLEENPDFAEAYGLYAEILRAQGLWTEAKNAYQMGLAIDPGAHEVRLNLGCLLLLEGDLQAGWVLYEARWQEAAAAQNRARLSLLGQAWAGESLEGKSLFIYAEQGLGDNLQFVRYLDVLKNRFGTAKLFYLCPAELFRLFSPLADHLSIHLISEEKNKPTALPNTDFHTPLLDLPRYLGTYHLSDIPSTIPYLAPNRDDLYRFQTILPKTQKKRIGIAWKGSERLNLDALRSLSFCQIEPLLALTHLEWVSLQKETAEKDERLQDLSAHCHDFADTAALIKTLDLVISVDTAIIHLAGALGAPAYLLNRFDPDWRWGKEGEKSPWYPSVTILRQSEFGNWTEVIESLVAHCCSLPKP